MPFPALYPDLVLRYGSNFRPMSRFHADAAAGMLPQVVMIEPGYLIGRDDHPPRNTQLARCFMHDVVKSSLYSPLWPRTACVVTYDEWGGFFDHVAPPVLDDDPAEMGRPAGFRVPGLIVGPWARRGVVSSDVKDQGALVDVDAAYRAVQAIPLDGPAFLDAAVTSGVVPRELDLRPRVPGAAVPSPYLDPASLPAAPLWLAR